MLYGLRQRSLIPRSKVVSPGTEYDKNNWDDCGLHIDDILTNNATYNGFSKADIEHNYTWLGSARGLVGSPQNETFFLTYQGCLDICRPASISWNTRQQGLNIAATWIFPLAILINLPFERAILATISNWLGSPQTALTASIWNFWQTRQCHWRSSGRKGFLSALWRVWNFPLAWVRRSSAPETTAEERTRINAFYVLSCFNQFELGLNTAHNTNQHREKLIVLLSTLIYGLFRPLSTPEVATDHAAELGDRQLNDTSARLEVLRQAIQGDPRHGDDIGNICELRIIQTNGEGSTQNFRSPPDDSIEPRQEEVDGQNGVPAIQHLGGNWAGSLQREVNEQNRDQCQPLQGQGGKDIERTMALLSALAHQLRINRRRGMIPTLLSLVTFYLAFAFSIVLAFSDLSDSTTIFVLDIGIFFSWVPIFVVFSILDRNPGDSDHQRKLMSRWLYNVNAVKKAGANEPAWWSGDDNDHPKTKNGCLVCTDPYAIGEFIGQGRTLSYCGLVSAILLETQKPGVFGDWDDAKLKGIAGSVPERVFHLIKRPKIWFTISAVCLAVVWIQIMLAFAADFITPTVGPGCWSLGFFFYGCFSTVTWVSQFWPLNKRRSRGVRGFLRWISHFLNALAVIYIVLILFVFSSGILNNCYCNSVMGGTIAGWGGYVDFKSFDFYRENYSLTNPWIGLAVAASFVSIISLVTALFWWCECGQLWAEQKDTGLKPINMRWVGQ